jgi:hypothetical protein
MNPSKQRVELDESGTTGPSGPKKRRWRRLGVALIAVIVVGAAALLGWKLRSAHRGPGAVLQASLLSANVGDYDEATENLPPGNRQVFREDPKMMKAVWDKVTKNGTVDRVHVSRDDRGLNGEFGDIEFSVTYKDGSTIGAKEKIAYTNGRWTHGIEEFYESVLRHETEAAFDALTVALADDYTNLRGSGVTLRLPDGCVWNAKEGGYDHAKLRILITVDDVRSRSVASLDKEVEAELRRADTTRLHRRDVEQNGAKGSLYQAIRTNKQGGQWQLMYLVLGNKERSALVTAILPAQEKLVAALQECLSSFRWEAN